MANEAKKQQVEKLGIQYGRRWEIRVYKPGKDETGQRSVDKDMAIDVSDLRCIFTVKYDVNSFITIGTLAIYNLNVETETSIIKEGMQISIFAGYEQAQYGEVFTGDIIQIIRNREDGVNYKLEILAANAIKDFDWNFVRSSIAANSDPRQQIKAVCEKADKKMQVGEVSKNLSQQTLPRGKILFGKPFKYLRDIAIHNNAFFEKSGGKVNMHGVNDEIPENMTVKLAPETGLVGTPKYTDNGIIIKTLLDPRIKPRTLIWIDNSIIQRTLISIDPQMQTKKDTKGNASASNEQQNQKNMFDKDGEYEALSITHQGDTWGDEWTTEIIGLSRNGRVAIASAIASPEQSLQA